MILVLCNTNNTVTQATAGVRPAGMGAAEYIMGRKLAVLKAIQVRSGLRPTPETATPNKSTLYPSP